ncbi:MAG: DNA-formamidopyrimidine glycosylase [Burkholderiales bacterium PBB4]|nr:MAG: DNA-formamidopyrimidine glycosylase [Burkholderiales bacterium PBB4]
MPELPEVEVTRLSFANRIAGAQILAIRLGKPLRWPLGCEPGDLVEQTVLQVRRRGKYLLMDLTNGLLLIHLGMSGSLAFEHGMEVAGAHDHFDMTTTRGTLRLHDPRRFGAVVFAQGEGDPVAQKLLGKLGVEPLGGDFDLSIFAIGLKKRSAPIKQVLLAGDIVVGVGNIYASEALFLSSIRPTTRANRLTGPRVRKLHAAVREVLTRAVEKGGSTLRNFSNAQGQNGYFQLEANVYGREGMACRVCTTPVKAIRQGQRSSFFCPSCQKS